MSRSRTVFFGALSGAIMTSGASAESISTLGAPTKAKLQTIGKAAPVEDKKPKLALGSLRTAEAELPPKEESYEERMELRHEAARARQEEIDRARREAVENK